MIDVTDGPAYMVRAIMTYIPVILVCLEGKPHIGARFTVLFIFATWLTEVVQDNIGGVAGMLILFLCFMITQFAPTMIMVWYCISTTKISEFMAAMNRMHLPQGLTISIAVMMRFFPTLSEEYRAIRDANFNLSVADGECVLLCGVSGCGKTTVTRLINGLIPHFFKGELSGEVYVNNLEIKQQELYNLAGIVGSVFQNPRSQFFSVDTDGEIVFGPENIGLEKGEILSRKEQVVRELNLKGLLERSLFDLSGGEKQKIACASVAALLPNIIILDEPSSNLDWAAIHDLRVSMQLWKSQGKTIIISEHRLWYLKDVIDRAVYMEKGRIIKQWTKDEFSALTEDELKDYELRPVLLEERYIQQFSNDSIPADTSPIRLQVHGRLRKDSIRVCLETGPHRQDPHGQAG